MTSLANFCGKLCAALLAIPQIGGVTIDIYGEQERVKYRLYDAFEGYFSFSVESVERSALDPDDMIDYMLRKAKDFINAPTKDVSP